MKVGRLEHCSDVRGRSVQILIATAEDERVARPSAPRDEAAAAASSSSGAVRAEKAGDRAAARVRTTDRPPRRAHRTASSASRRRRRRTPPGLSRRRQNCPGRPVYNRRTHRTGPSRLPTPGCTAGLSRPTTDQPTRGEHHGRHLHLRRLFQPRRLRLRQRRRLGRLLGQAGPRAARPPPRLVQRGAADGLRGQHLSAVRIDAGLEHRGVRGEGPVGHPGWWPSRRSSCRTPCKEPLDWPDVDRAERRRGRCRRRAEGGVRRCRCARTGACR